MSLASGGLSAADMAEYLGVSRQTLSRWMSDHGPTPKRAYVLQWALRTGVDPEWLEGLPRLDSNQQPAVYPSAPLTRRLCEAA